MGLKGINPIEQHAEKIFAGTFVVALLGVLAWQFVGKPNTVKVGKDDVPLRDAYSKIAEEARRTEARIRSGAPDGLPSDAGEALAKLREFDTRLQGGVSPSRELASALGAGGSGGLQGIVAPAGAAAGAFAQLVVPAPSRPVGAAHLALIDSWEIQRDPAVAKVLPAQQPLDKASVSIESTFDGAALRAALSHDPDEAGPIGAIPKNWWDGNMQILAVLAERQEMKPDGSWSDPTPVMLMPGRMSLAGDLAKLNTAAAIKDAMRIATEQENDVRRPEYYAIRMGEKWAPPTEREKVQLQEGQNARRIADLRAQRDREIKRREALEKQLGGASGGGRGTGRDNAPPPPRGTGRTGGAGGPGTPPPGGSGGGDDARRRSLQAELDRVMQRLAKVEEDLRALGDTSINQSTGSPTPSPGTGADGKPSSTSVALLDDPNIRLWLHDVGVERGKTYRYRSSVALNNPFFGHGAAMAQDQQAWAAPGVIKSEWSEWSAPINVAPETLVFITSAAEDNQADRPASARAEVFHFKWGFWRRGTSNVLPGDALAAQVKVPDYSKIITMDAADPNAPGGQAPGGAPGAAPGGRGGGRVGAPGGAGGRDQPPANGPVMTPPPIQTMDLGPAQPVIFLGVGSSEGTDRGRTVKVYVRDQDGRLGVRYPEDEKDDLDFQRARASAERGERELLPPAPANRPNPGTQPPRDSAPPPPDRVPPPGGG